MRLNNQEDWFWYKRELDLKGKTLYEHSHSPEKYPAEVTTQKIDHRCYHIFTYQSLEVPDKIYKYFWRRFQGHF